MYLQSSLTYFREAHFLLGPNYSLIFLGGVELALENAAAAYQCYREALLLFAGNLSNQPFLSLILAGMAAVARFRGSYRRTAVLLGKASMDWMQMMNWDHPHFSSYDRDIAAARSQLGDEAFEQAWAVGQAMTKQEAGDYALADEADVLDDSALPSAIDSLTTRELEILRLVETGLSNREIAQKLIFSVGTVKWYVHQIYNKLGVGSRTQAIARARVLELLP